MKRLLVTCLISIIIQPVLVLGQEPQFVWANQAGGSSSEYSKSIAIDSEGNNYELWARLEFELFKLQRIRWRAEADHNVPAQALEMIES